MKKVYSLKSRKFYKIVFTKGGRFRGKGFIIFIFHASASDNKQKNMALKNIKIGITVTKQLGKAHKRNWIKRRIKAVCGELIKQMNSNYFIIIKPGPGIETMSFKELECDLITVFRNAGLIDGKTKGSL